MYKYIFIPIILLIAVSCENEIPFNIKDNPPKLILNSIISADRDSSDIILGYTGRDYATLAEKASIDIYVNGELKDHISKPYHMPNPFGVEDIRYKTGVKLNPGDLLKVEARTDDGQHHVWSETTVPHRITIERIDTASYLKDNWWNDVDKFIRVKTTFTDNGPQVNYYQIAITIDATIEAKSKTTGADTIVYFPTRLPLFINEDIVLTDGRPSMENDDNDILPPVENLWGIFDNSRINGTYTMTTGVQIPNYFFENDFIVKQNTYMNFEQITKAAIKVRIQLMSINKPLFFYLKALNIYDSVNYDNFFNQPVKFPSNINGGTGVFGVCIGDEIVLDLGEYIPKEGTE